MIEFLTAPGNGPFVTSICIMILLATVEVLSLVLGHSLTAVVGDGGFSLDGHDAAHHVGIDTDGHHGFASAFLSWLGVGRAPLLVVVVVFCTVFGLGGLALQSAFSGIFGSAAPAWLAAIATLVPSLVATRILAVAFSRIVPKEETYVSSTAELVGRSGVITIGVARAGMPAETRVTDAYGNNLYVSVVPEDGAPEIPSGTKVVLVSRKGSGFVAIPAPNRDGTSESSV